MQGCFLTDGHGILYARPRPRFGSYAPILLKQVLLLLVEIMNLLSKCGLLRSVIQRPEYQEFTKTWVEAEYEYIKPYIMPNGQRKTPVLSITKSPVGLGLGDKLSTTPIGQGKGS